MFKYYFNIQTKKNFFFQLYYKGCINPLGLGYARELAKRGFNLIIIDKNPTLLDQLATHLSKKNNL